MILVILYYIKFLLVANFDITINLILSNDQVEQFRLQKK